jgi:GNAT superfamily N-acetyltransferase
MSHYSCFLIKKNLPAFLGALLSTHCCAPLECFAGSLNKKNQMSSPIIRKAIATDCPRLLELITELAVYEKAPNAVTVSINHFIESGFGPKPVWWALVIEVDGFVQGFALWYVRYSTWKGQRLYLEDILVTEAERGKGLGKRLFDAVVAEAKLLGYSGMVWQVLDWNTPAINFYKKYQTNFDAEWVNCSIDF